MKNLSLILNGILTIAIIILFYLHFQKSAPVENLQPEANSTDTIFKEVAFVNTDTLLKYYNLTEVLSKQLDTKRDKFEKEFRNRQQGLQKEISDYQENQRSLTISQARSIEEGLMKKQQDLQVYQQNLSDQLMREQNKINMQLYDNVAEFLGNYGRDNNLKLVLTFTKGNPNLLYAHDSLDITNIVIEGLNKKYEESKTQKQDSTRKK